MTAKKLAQELGVSLDADLLAEVRALRTAAYEDELTGLPNRRALLRELDRRAGDRRRYDVLFLDLDGFKQINDDYGHDAGDETLKHAAKRLRARLRRDDYLARWGGDEFVVILRASDLEGAIEKLGRRLRQAGMPDVGVSVGSSNGANKTALVEADRRMYDAKRERRVATC